MRTSYTGKILRVNLTEAKTSVEDLNMEYARQYIGGRGLGSRMLLDEIDPMVDPLSVENKLIFITGPLTGVRISTGNRFMVVTKSPLNNCIASSNSGGVWGAKLKFVGYDAIIVEGSSETPVYLDITPESVEIRDASALWGKDTLDVEETLKEGNKDTSVLNISPAGETLSLMAAIMNDGDRAAARTGVGAVMGSKKLKAIRLTVKNSAVDTADEEFSATTKEIAGQMKMNMLTGVALPAYGTAVNVGVLNDVGGFPHKNWQEGYFEKYENTSGETLQEQHLVKNAFCYRCSIGCTRVVDLDGHHIAGPEYETLWGFGGNADNDNMESIFRANHMCNEYGLDTISTSSTIACGMELYERGMISESDCEGYPLEFGNWQNMLKWVERIGKGETQLGKLMAKGSYALAEAYGDAGYSMSVKKLEMPAYDPRALQGMGLNYATSNRGGCHVRGNTVVSEVMGIPDPYDRLGTEDKAELVVHLQDMSALIDSLGMCLFTSFSISDEQYCMLYNKATGFDLSLEEFHQAARRIYSFERYFNKLAGMDPADDTLPKRLLTEPLTNEFSEGSVNRLHEMLPRYYELRGWESGFPTDETLTQLSIP